MTVVLVGAMHYNPTSIELASTTIDKLGKDDELGSVIIESCDVRYNENQNLTDRFPIIRTLLRNEMGAALDKSFEYNRPVILGDQRINVTTTRIGDAFKECVGQLFTLQWPTLYTTIKEALAEAAPQGPGYLGAFALLDPKLILTTPLSFVKYPASYFIKSPLVAVVVFGVLIGSSALDDGSATAATFGGGAEDLSTTELVLDWLASLVVAALEVVVFSRVFAKELLAERNVVLAKNILQQCQYYSKTEAGSTSSGSAGTNGPWWDQLFSSVSLPGSASPATNFVMEEDEVVYVPEGPIGKPERDGKDKTVVAVLGMAHCNGIKKLLAEELVL